MPKPKSFEVAEKRKRTTAEFTLSDDPDVTLRAIQPKSARLLPLAKIAESGDDLANAQVIEAFIELVMDEPSREYLNERLMDEDDAFDVQDLTPIIEWLQEQWAERPTGPPPGSSARRRTTGPRSTAGVRSAG